MTKLTPSTYMANITATMEVVEVLSVKGGWTTIRHRDGTESKVRNSAIEQNNLLLSFADQAALEAKRAAPQRVKITESVDARDARVAKEQRKLVEPTCPKCGSTSLYNGCVKATEGGMGIVVDEEYITGCRECDWVEDSRTNRIPGMRYVKNAAYRPKDYRRCVSAHGHTSYDCGDQVAKMLEGKELDEVYELAADLLDIPLQTLAQKYGHLNVGMQRMNLGNRLRTYFNKKNGD